MPHQPFDFQDLLQLIELMKSTSQFSEFRLRVGDIELELRRGPAGTSPLASADASPVGAPAPAVPLPLAQGPALADEARSRSESRPPVKVHAEGVAVVKSPMVGTVYLSPEPGANPFVEVGQAVESNTQLCIVEVMKLMNSVSVGCKGVVSEILVGDGEAVEFGQALFVITRA